MALKHCCPLREFPKAKSCHLMPLVEPETRKMRVINLEEVLPLSSIAVIYDFNLYFEGRRPLVNLLFSGNSDAVERVQQLKVPIHSKLKDAAIEPRSHKVPVSKTNVSCFYFIVSGAGQGKVEKCSDEEESFSDDYGSEDGADSEVPRPSNREQASTSSYWDNVVAAMHPELPLIALTHSPNELELINMDTSERERLSSPLALTSWADDYVIVALPPLACNPKVLRMDITTGGGDFLKPDSAPDVKGDSDDIFVLREQIYFPTPTPQRSPSLAYRPMKPGSDGLYLVLGPILAEPEIDGNGGQEKNDASQRSYHASPPVVLRWTIPRVDGWRAWDVEVDQKLSEQIGRQDMLERLRGSFVDDRKSFTAPVRCGLNWTRKGVLTCG
ncbi:hypothetical protein LX32DRAFT_687963 [Colletotrichum zoysiae]|uniref:Uncharacterized protein n=1 Tax=Colletotrichum zoysiae TaxID=1216348 RepID=A0AAD9LTC2_9PEZI|nr:hypothetical protein LX32DRAFT_687963 [Colletotrichum zoysiae]